MVCSQLFSKTIVVLQKHLILLLLLFHPSSAGIYSKTLADWCHSDHLIGDPLGLPANERFNKEKNTCTQTFAIFDEKRASEVCSNKAPFAVTHSFDSKKGITCVWGTKANCPNDNSITFYDECLELSDDSNCKRPYTMTTLAKSKFLAVILRGRGEKAMQVRVMETKASRDLVVKQYGYGTQGFVKNAPEDWRPALVVASEPMLKIPSGSIIRADIGGLKLKRLCKVDSVRQSGSSEGDFDVVISRNVYQPGVKTDMHDLDVMKFHQNCSELCEGCYASHEPKATRGDLFWVPVRRKSDKKHDPFDQCNVNHDVRQLKQYFVQEFPGSSEVMADDTKWADKSPNAECAAAPRSAAVYLKDQGWLDMPPFVRRFLLCTNGLRTDRGGTVACIANSQPVNGVCECKKGFIDVHEVASGFEEEKAMYEKGMYCVVDCVQNSEHVGTSCRCKKGFVDVWDVDGHQDKRNQYSKGQYCVEEIHCGKYAAPSYASKKCECEEGYIPRTKDKKEKEEKDVTAEYCVKRRSCQDNSKHIDGENVCECKDEYVNVVTLADSRSTKYDEEDGFCVKKVKCGDNAHEVFLDGKPKNKCNCNNGFLDIHDSGEDSSNYERGQMCFTTTTTTTKRPLTKNRKCQDLAQKMRFIMVIDQSGSIEGCFGNLPCANPGIWKNDVVPFINEIGKLLNPEVTTVNLCFFSHSVNCTISFTPGWTLSHFESTMKSVTYTKGGTFTMEAVDQAFNIMKYDEVNENKIILVVSDGAPSKSSDSVTDHLYPQETILKIDEFKRENPSVKVLAAGIGPYITEGVVLYYQQYLTGMEVLKKIASTEDDAVYAGVFKSLQADKVKAIIDKVCEDVWG